MKKYKISANLIQVIKHLYDKATCAVLFNSDIGHWFRSTIGSPTGMPTLTHPLQHILQRIMSDALEDHEGSVNIGGRTTINPRFADDIDRLAKE